MNQPSPALAAAMRAAAPQSNIPDKLDAIRDVARQLRDREKEILDLDERLKATKTEVLDLKHKKLVDLMQGEIGLSQPAREAAGGWAPTGTQPRRYPLPREGLLLDTARAVAALVGQACCGAAVPRCGSTGAGDRAR